MDHNNTAIYGEKYREGLPSYVKDYLIPADFICVWEYLDGRIPARRFCLSGTYDYLNCFGLVKRNSKGVPVMTRKFWRVYKHLCKMNDPRIQHIPRLSPPSISE